MRNNGLGGGVDRWEWAVWIDAAGVLKRLEVKSLHLGQI
jgi:hypothetical protein